MSIKKIQKDKHIKKTDRYTKGHPALQTGRHIDVPTDEQTDEETDGQKEKQANKTGHANISITGN